MAVKTREELIQLVSDRIGDDNSDEALSLIEDVTDTLTDLETKVKGDGTDWKAEYDKLDNDWREKYKARFTDGDNNDNSNNNNKKDNDGRNDDEIKSYKYEDLFTTKE